MIIAIMLLFLGAILAQGAMVARALPTPSPRMALAGALVFALLTDASMAWASLFGFDARAIDVLLALALAGCALVWRRTRRQGDARPLWPGARVMAFLGAALLLYLVPALVVPVPLDTDAQGFGYLALMVREGGTLDTLAPFHPEISYLYSPAFLALAAYVSARFGAGLHEVQMALGAGLGFLCVWLAYDLGNELHSVISDRPTTPAATPRFAPGLSRQDTPPAQRTGPVMLVLAVIGTGLFTAYMDSHFTTLLGFVFALAFVTFVVRFLRGGARLWDGVAGAVCLAAAPLAHPDTTVILMIGYIPFLLTIWLARERPALRTWLGLAAGMPLGALLIVAPWLLRLWPLLGSEIASPYVTEPFHLGTMLVMSGFVVPALAAGGVVLAARRRGAVDVWMLTWLAAVVEFGALGQLERVFPFLAALLKYDYPFSIAWHGPVIPYLYLAALAALWLGARVGWARVEAWAQRGALPALGAAAALIVCAGVFIEPILVASKDRLSFYGAFSSHADVEAMRWLKENTPPFARILNYGTNHEADWAPIIAERDTVFYRPQMFFRGAEASLAEQDALRGFWADPADLAWAEALAARGVDYVLVPQIIANPGAAATMFRWRAPYVIEARSTPADAPYLELVFDDAGAQVYAVRSPALP